MGAQHQLQYPLQGCLVRLAMSVGIGLEPKATMGSLTPFPQNCIGSTSCWPNRLSSSSLTLGLCCLGPSRSRPKDAIRCAKYVLGKTLLRKMGGSSDGDTGEGELDRGLGGSVLDLSAVLRKLLKPKSLPEESHVSQKWTCLRILWHSVIGHKQPWEV